MTNPGIMETGGRTRREDRNYITDHISSYDLIASLITMLLGLWVMET